jgi:hypothetical protein
VRRREFIVGRGLGGLVSIWRDATGAQQPGDGLEPSFQVVPTRSLYFAEYVKLICLAFAHRFVVTVALIFRPAKRYGPHFFGQRIRAYRQYGHRYDDLHATR